MANKNVKKTFGASIRSRRHVLGISQEALAERADLHRTYISDIERGARNLSLESIERLAHALEVSVSVLFLEPDAQDGRTIHDGRHRLDLVDILLVEDNADDVAMTLSAFKKAHFANRVQVVCDGAEALDYIFCTGKYSQCKMGERPQVILLDLLLPKVSGLEVLRCIKADKRTRLIPVVILTVSQDGRDMAECRRLGADSYIVKPVDFQRLSLSTPRLDMDWALLKPPDAKPRNARVSAPAAGDVP